VAGKTFGILCFDDVPTTKVQAPFELERIFGVPLLDRQRSANAALHNHHGVAFMSGRSPEHEISFR
jgi:hypothetical protein